MSATDVLFAVALALLTAGVALIYVPAALIVAGLALGAFTVLLERGTPSDPGASK